MYRHYIQIMENVNGVKEQLILTYILYAKTGYCQGGILQ